MPWLVPEIINADVGELGHDAFEGRHDDDDCHRQLAFHVANLETRPGWTLECSRGAWWVAWPDAVVYSSL